MGIESEITRIKNAKLSIKNAIQEKGVEVEDTTIDNYPDKIRQIQTVSIEVIEKLQSAINSHSKELKLFCVEPVTVIVEDTEYICQVNEVTTVFVGDKSFEIIPQSNNSIQSLLNYPIPLVWYDWLEGVDVFENIIFDMNSWDTYHHWNQNYQAEYHVQKAQYINCIFWSDNPYIQTPLNERTNYTIYYSSSLPLCYSTIPENTYKPFYCAYGVQDDPNWRNSEYISSFSNVVEATQTWSYYGARSIGVYNMGVDIITLPKDCRGLMFYATSIQNIGILDATKTTTFGSKSGSWRDAFGYCYMLENLYIQNLKVSINVSWSPINNASIEFIVNSAANTSKIYIYVSPYTWYRLTENIKTSASSKNIVIECISSNYLDDIRLNIIQNSGDGNKFLTDDGTYKNIELPSLDGYAKLEDIPTIPEIPIVPTKVSAFENDSNYVSLEVVQQMIADAIANLNKPEEPDTPVDPEPDIPVEPEEPTESIGSITDDNSIVIDETQLENGTYTLRYIDSNDNIIDNFNEIVSFEINK